MLVLFRIISVVGLALLILASCVHDSTQIAQSEWERLIAIRGEARELFHSQLLSRYDLVTLPYTEKDKINWAGQNRMVIAQTASDENLRLLQKIEDNYPADSEDELKVRRLRHYLLSLRGSEMIADAAQYLHEMRKTARFNLGEQQIDLSTLLAILAESRDRDLRQHAFVLWMEQLKKENAILERIVNLQDSAAVLSGYGDYASLAQEEQELDYALLSDQARQFLAGTDTLYTQLAELVIPKLIGIKSNKLRGYDMMLLSSASQAAGLSFDDSVKARLVVALERMGLSADSSRTISFARVSDFQGRAETFPLVVPGDVRVVLGEKGNLPEYLHELGHALHYSYTGEREFEFSQLGQGGLKEAYAFLLEGLLDEPEFVKENLGLTGTRLSEYLVQRAFNRLLAIRSYCGDLLFEQEVFAGLPELRSEFEMIKQPITGFAWTDIEREQLFQRVDNFSSAEYLTGWFLAARIREHLREEFGDAWFDSPRAGEYMKSLWRNGTRLSSQSIAHSLGDSLVAPDALIRELSSPRVK